MNSKMNRFLTLVIIMQALMLAGQWITTSLPAAASAQVPDAGGQRVQMIDELRSMNSKLDNLTTLLESGKLQVRATGMAEDKK